MKKTSWVFSTDNIESFAELLNRFALIISETENDRKLWAAKVQLLLRMSVIKSNESWFMRFCAI